MREGGADLQGRPGAFGRQPRGGPRIGGSSLPPPRRPQSAASLPRSAAAAGSHLNRRTNLGREGDSPGTPPPKRKQADPRRKEGFSPLLTNQIAFGDSVEIERDPRPQPRPWLCTSGRGAMWKVALENPACSPPSGGRGQERPLCRPPLGTAGESGQPDPPCLPPAVARSLFGPFGGLSRHFLAGKGYPPFPAGCRRQRQKAPPPERLYSCHFRGRNQSKLRSGQGEEGASPSFPGRKRGLSMLGFVVWGGGLST